MKEFSFYLDIFENRNFLFTQIFTNFKCNLYILLHIADNLSLVLENYWGLSMESSIEINGIFLFGNYIFPD